MFSADVQWAVLTVDEVVRHRALGLVRHAGTAAAFNRQVVWAATTELDDPGRFLAGGELVLTTGLRQLNGTEQRGFVGKLAAAGAAGLGFGVGPTHQSVPAATINAARELDLALFQVPDEIPFLAVGRFVADRVLSEHFDRPRRLLQAYDQLAVAVMSEGGLTAMIRSLQRIVGGPVAVLGERGEILADAPYGHRWDLAQLLAEPFAEQVALPVELEGQVVAHLCAHSPKDLADVLPYAVALVGLEISGRRAVLAGQRLLLADVIADVLAGSITDAEARRRLARFDVDLEQPNTVLLGTADGSREQLRRKAAGPLSFPAAVTAWIDSTLVVVLRGSSSTRDAAQGLIEHLGRESARVGIGGSRIGLSGLRWSYYEAQQAMDRGGGIQYSSELSIAGLLAATEDVPIGDLAAETLRPLMEFDQHHGTELISTLRSFLDCDGSVSRVAAALSLHRNTVRYRLDQIARISGRGIDSTADRLQWYLALLAVDRGQQPRR